RFIKAATFEGRTPGGRVTNDLIEFHRATSAGGVGVSTVAYLAVAPDGRTDRNVIVLRPSMVPELTRITEAIAAHGAVPAAQIGHAGPVANAKSNGVPAYGPRRQFHPLSLKFIRAATRDDLRRIVENYRDAARVATDSGFKILEVHGGHHYLLSAFLSPFMNRRDDDYGGALPNRVRLMREVFTAVRDAVDPSVAITVKLNMTDGVKGGLTMEDSIATMKMLETDGTIDAIELTAGSSFASPMYLFKGPAPLREFGRTLPWFLRPGFRLVGGKFMRDSEYHDGYFLDMASNYLTETKLPVIALGGVSSIESVNDAIARGFSFVAMGRALLAEPDLIDRWKRGDGARARCTHCNLCIPTIYTGTRCLEFDVPSHTITDSLPD
ncbi:MAG: NADH:flavin oxidoreductase, partial [Acidimicrobiia bacterium]